MKKYQYMLAGAAFLAVPALCHAGIVANVDFAGNQGWEGNSVGIYNGPAAAGTTGTTWNESTVPRWWGGTGKFLDENGGVTDIELTGYTGNAGHSSYAATDPSGTGALMGDYGVYANGTNYAFNAAFKIQNTLIQWDNDIGGFTNVQTSAYVMSTSDVFDIYVYAGREGGTYTLGSSSGSETLSATAAGDWDGVFDEGSDYVVFRNVSGLTDWTGNVWFDFTMSLNPGETSTISGMQIVQVPEPATIGLIGFAGAGVLFVRRRFRI